MPPVIEHLNRLSQWPRHWLFVLFATLTLLVATADYFSGERYTVYVLYFPIVALGCWVLGMRSAVVLSFFASILWIADDVFAPPEPMPYLAKYWQAFTRFLVFVAFAYVLSRLRAALVQQQYLSHYDALTALPNRTSLFEIGQRDVARCRRTGLPLTAVFIDLDGFKQVNDTAGHAEGDRILQVAANTIRASCRDLDLPARIGGDEFVVILPGTDYDQAEIYICRLQDQLTQAMADGGWQITFSIGVATFSSLPSALDEIVKTADDLMYAVKRRQKNAMTHRLVEADGVTEAEDTFLQAAAV